MKIKHISMTSTTALAFEAPITAPICVLRGRYSDLALDLLRELFGDYGAEEDPDRVDDGCFVLHADAVMEGKDYSVCYIRNADTMGDNRLAANFKPNSLEYSEEDTRAFLANRREDVFCVLKDSADVQGERSDRPVLVYGYFDKLDHGTDLAPILAKLASDGRQVFVSVCPGYPAEELMAGAQVIDVCDDFYTEIICPVCGEKTYDNYWICPVCLWEYDGLPEDFYSAANGNTLVAYREEFLKRKEKGGV